MATIKRFEDLQVWQKARELCQEIHAVTKYEPFSKDYRFRDQIRAASGSIMDNIAEGFERGGRKEFVQFLSISKASSAEVRSQLYRALDQNYISKKDFSSLYKKSDDIGKMINGLIKYLNNSDHKGVKYKVEEPVMLPSEYKSKPNISNTKQSNTKLETQNTKL